MLACDAAGIHPITGTDLALPDGCRAGFLARQGGWSCLVRLVSAAHLGGERGTPVVSRDLLARYADRLVVLLGPASDVGRALAERRYDLARARLDRWREVAGDVVLEIVDRFGPARSADPGRAAWSTT